MVARLVGLSKALVMNADHQMDDLMQMAEEAGFNLFSDGLRDDGSRSTYLDCWPEQLAAFAQLVAKKAVEAERANRPYWLCCGGIDPQVHRWGCIEAKSGHPERCVFGTAAEHSVRR